MQLKLLIAALDDEYVSVHSCERWMYFTESVVLSTSYTKYCAELMKLLLTSIVSFLSDQIIWKICHMEMNQTEEICQNLTNETNADIQVTQF